MAKQVKSQKKITPAGIVSMYMDSVLENEKYPKSVYKFAKENKISEEQFYSFYGSLEALQKDIWVQFYNNAAELIKGSAELQEASNRDKLLTFFYTLFEILTANRSYVLYVLNVLNENDQELKNLKQLKDLRKHILNFASDLVEDENDEQNIKFLQRNKKIYAEGTWLQFLFLLKFWKEDDSASFEKTDVAIEKSVNTIFDILDNSALERVFDLGKFLYKEILK
ncbi:heat-shock protein [Psychroflexus sp. S27]|uniref:TetR family transcriptional regulator C-terminal domain-containing protein n=1 Tax=Psychroflexus sp. S27 TaxID=1982757 RepID=UPI000C2B22DB|nr:TetR family transcriptional regulator C-terminal domain-containing protein [Psychroflexus sp. S27]PJX23291.1 heat-shock protein [Psychroflexus sp. S27]